MTRLLGASLYALVFFAVTIGALLATGHVPMFAADRGRLQLLVVVPAISLITGGVLACVRPSARSTLLWSAAPIVALSFLGIATFAVGFRDWFTALVLGAVLVLPWIAGIGIGSMLSRKSGSGGESFPKGRQIGNTRQ